MADFPINLPWAFGSPSQKAETGGIMVRAWMDSIYPYTKPDPPPSWWNDEPGPVPPADPGNPGAFPGFQRNMRESAGLGAKNFPEDRPFNTVILNTPGLIQSATAPWRFERAGEDAWPQNMEIGVTTLLDYYKNNYLEDDTYVILLLPERELMNMYAKPTDVTLFSKQADPKTMPDPEMGRDAITAVVLGAFSLFGDRLIGWFLVDEPDVDSFKRAQFVNAQNMTDLRNLIRTQEEQFATNESVELWHRPCIITFSSSWYFHAGRNWATPQTPPRIQIQPESLLTPYAPLVGRGLDMAWFNHYPWRISKGDVPREHSVAADNSANSLKNDPIGAALMLRELMKRFNPDPAIRIGSSEYIPVMAWLQTHGKHYRLPINIQFPAGANVEPDDPPAPNHWVDGSGDDATVTAVRWLRRPTPDEARFEAWLSIFGGSEGLAYFSQPKVSDDLIVETHAPVAEEISYFSNLRVQAPGLPNVRNWTKVAILNQFYTYPPEVQPPYTKGYMIPLVRIYEYLNPSGTDPESKEYWMFILNRAAGQLDLTLQMARGAWRWGIEEWAYGAPVPDCEPIDFFHKAIAETGRLINGTPFLVTLRPLDAFRFRLYKCTELHPK